MDKIICLIGESGSGKDTIADLLAARLNWNKIKSYTTREKRFEEEDTHTFTNGKFDDYGMFHIADYNGNCFTDTFIGDEEMAAHEELYGEHYFMTHNQYKNKGTSIYVTSPRGAEQTKMNAECEVVTVYLQADEGKRRGRLNWRYYNNIKEHEDIDLVKIDGATKEEKIEELIANTRGRIERDKDIFHTINQVDHVIDANADIETVYERVKEAIK